MDALTESLGGKFLGAPDDKTRWYAFPTEEATLKFRELIP